MCPETWNLMRDTGTALNGVPTHVVVACMVCSDKMSRDRGYVVIDLSLHVEYTMYQSGLKINVIAIVPVVVLTRNEVLCGC